MDLTILVPLLVVLAGLIFVQRRQKQQAKAAVDEEKKGRGKRAAARSGSKKSAPAAVRQAAAVSPSEPEEIEVSEDWGWEAVPDVEAEAAAVNVAQEVDALTEYKVYKQFGYHEKAAESLSQYLTSGSAAVSDGMRSTLVNELVQLWLDAKKPDELAETLRQFGNLLTKAQTEDYIKQGLAVDKNNLNLRVLAEEVLGWGVQQTSAEIGERNGLDAPAQSKQTKQKSRRAVAEAENEQKVADLASVKTRKELVTNSKYAGAILVHDEEKAALMGFMEPESGYRLMKDRLAYDAAVSYANKAIRQANKPAALIIDALSLDYKNQNIDRFAQHLWQLYYTLGQYGRQVKERMLGWGLNLGEHPIFTQLEANPNEAQLREIGIANGFLDRGTSTQKAHRKPLIRTRTDDVSVKQTPAEKVLRDVESLLMYGQLDEAMNLLEESILEYPSESQLYITLFDICERAEEWERLEQVLHKIRANIQHPPEEVVLAMSQLLQKINYGSVRT
ncbi:MULTISPECIES: hypothetical protein [Eikenella]|jgi:hypothetical protein|uniref:23S rRNA methyltransferase n=2 Tax=Eikenella corrodens TaxID=539 RepID=A0A1A9RIS1_EIKCO|nr:MULTISPECIES: hypothetical protein [Eikenella]EEG23464.1 hypothetical protein EIKCOROL_01914 [Eikenella corrodens ATCC 23834]MDU4299695.1 hypothetical protein [Eikenella corrodens]OAM18286.1 hypothetical protein A7P85_00990 [Eikenella corrodens]OAM18887.1 hypothetical protein A7P90_06380 [Eikenella corrodens]OAM19394.1 hypothetical protein A7P84_03550 [Eikenella corrodens]